MTDEKITLTIEEARALLACDNPSGTHEGEAFTLGDVVDARSSIRAQLDALQPKRWEDELLEWAEENFGESADDTPVSKYSMAAEKLKAIVNRARGEGDG